MKKRIVTIIMIIIFTLIGCGGESSKEAKELLQRILILVGIPQSIVVNICQDNNANNLCENSEILAKLTINKGDTLEDIWQKIEFDDANNYWLDQLDPDKKLLLVMQDTDNVRYDDGKFALPFTINPSREVNATKELSILEAMVDASYLNSSEVVEVKKMNFVDKFYDVLLKDLMKNFNTLKDKALDSSTSILSNIKFMAERLREHGISKTLPDSVNACGSDEACVDKIIARVFKDLEISSSQADIIAGKESGKKEETQQDSVQKLLYITKEIYPSSDFSSLEEEKDVTDFIYDSEHKLKIPNIKYDSKDRVIEIGEVKFEYNQHGLSSWDLGEDKAAYKVLEWSGEKPTKTELKSYNNIDRGFETWTQTITYTGDNPTHIEMVSNKNGNSIIISQEFDDKNTPYTALNSMFGGCYPSIFRGRKMVNAWGICTKHNIIKKDVIINHTSPITYKIDITYNSSDYPVKIDDTEHYNDKDGVKSTIIYEYEK